MPEHIWSQHNNFVGVGVSQEASLELPVSGVYHNLVIEYRRAGTLATEAQMRADVSRIELLINGVVMRSFTGAQLIDFNAHYGIAVQAGFLPLFFAEDWSGGRDTEESLAWGMDDVTNFTARVTLGATAVTPTLRAISERTMEKRILGAIKKVRRYNVAVAATGVNNWQTLPKSEALVAIHCNSTNISDVKVKLDDRIYVDLTKAQIDQFLAYRKDLQAVSGYTHLQFTPTKRLNDILPMTKTIISAQQAALAPIRELNFEFNMSAATSFDALVESIGTF